MKFKLLLSTVAYVALSCSLHAQVTVTMVRNYFYETAENPAMPVVFPEGEPAYFVKAETAELLQALMHNTPLDKNGTTPLDVAVQTFNTKWLNTLFALEFEAYQNLNSFKALIQDAIKLELEPNFSSLESYETIISQPLDAAGNTALHLAVAANKPSIVQALLERGANPNKYNVAQDLPMTLAIRGIIKQEIFNILVRYYANPNATGSLGNGFGHLLTYYRSPQSLEAMTTLVNKGMNMSAKAVYGDTPLHGATWIRNIAMIRRLKELGADINEPNKHTGQTPLHVAAQVGDKAVIDALLEFDNIDKLLTDQSGKQPSDVATNSWIANYLREKNL